MHYPDFYSQVDTILLHDSLSDFLGAFTDGKVEISYLDCVKLAGHSCPTVAGAYLMAQKGLESLYGSSLPKRGEVKVEMRGPEDEAVNGVVGNVIAFVIGASGVGGFKGIQGNYSRDNLLSYGNDISKELKLTRKDTGESVLVSYDPSTVPADEKMMPLMGKNLKGLASKDEKVLFNQLWQKRVEAILLNKDLHNTIIKIERS